MCAGASSAFAIVIWNLVAVPTWLTAKCGTKLASAEPANARPSAAAPASGMNLRKGMLLSDVSGWIQALEASRHERPERGPEALVVPVHLRLIHRVVVRRR